MESQLESGPGPTPPTHVKPGEYKHIVWMLMVNFSVADVLTMVANSLSMTCSQATKPDLVSLFSFLILLIAFHFSLLIPLIDFHPFDF